MNDPDLRSKPKPPHTLEFYKDEKRKAIRALGPRGWLRTLIHERRGLVLAFLLGILVLLLPSPPPLPFRGETILLTPGGQKVIALLVIFVAIFIFEAMPFGISIALVYSWVVLMRVFPAEKAAAMFSHDAAWFLVGALMIASVLIKYHLHFRLLSIILRLTGTRTSHLVISIVSVCAFTSMFIADHTIATLMFPIGIAVVEASGGLRKVPNLARVMMLAIAFGCSIGGLSTPSGGGRNVLMIGYLHEYFGVHVGYHQWLLMAFPVTLLLVPVVSFILLRLFPPEIKHLDPEGTRHYLSVSAVDPMGFREWSVVGIFFIVVVMWMTLSRLGIGMIAMFGALLYILAGLAHWEDYQRINWSVALLYFAAVGLGRCLIETGAATWLSAQALVSLEKLGITGGFPLITSGIVFISIVTQFMGDGPCVASMGPMLLETAKLAGIAPAVFGVAVAIASAFAFAIIIGTPPNAVVYGSGYLRARDFLISGGIILIAANIILLLVVRVWWMIFHVGIAGGL